MNIIALDLSTKKSGYAITIDGKTVFKYGSVAAASTNVEARIIKMRQEILQLIKDNKIDKIIAEEVPEITDKANPMNNHTRKMLNWLQGQIIIGAFEFNKNIEYEFLEPSSWRSKLGLQKWKMKREEYKKKDIEYAEARLNVDLAGDDDAADAICILYTILNKPQPIVFEDGFCLK